MDEYIKERDLELVIDGEPFQVNGERVLYNLMDSSLDEDFGIRYAVGVPGGKPFVSEQVPEEFRAYWLLHEALCPLAGFNKEPLESCLETEKYVYAKVVEDFPAEKVAEYVQMRKDMISDLIIFSEENQPEFAEVLKKNLAYLNSL